MIVLIFLFALPVVVIRKNLLKRFSQIKDIWKPNREFLALNKIQDGIMRKTTAGTELTKYEKERNKAISKVRYIVEQYFGLSHLYNKHIGRGFPN